MILKKIPKTILKVYLKRYPVNKRLSKLNGFKKWKKWKKFEPILKELQVELFPPTEGGEEKLEEESVVLAKKVGIQSFDNPYDRYPCHNRDALSCSEALGNPGEDLRDNACVECGFPSLLPKTAKIKGKKGIYRIDEYVGRRGLGRIYHATLTGINQSVVIKEYLLPKRYFNEEQTVQRKQLFQSLAGLSLADGRVQDSRLLQPLEAISDGLQERCYLVLDERNYYPSLNRYLVDGAMTPQQVFRVLDQVLQTLEFLHGQKFQFPTSQIQDGIVHGNLNLDSLLIGRENNLSLEKSDFFIYLCDLRIWEDLFKSPLNISGNSSNSSFINNSNSSSKSNSKSNSKTNSKSNSKTNKKSTELIDLGYIAFHLLNGKVVTESGEILEPRNGQNWLGVPPELKQFILRLMELEPPFENAYSARRELLSLPQNNWSVESVQIKVEPEEETKKTPVNLLLLLLTTLGLGIIASLIWILFVKPQFSNASSKTPQPCCIKDIKTIPPGKFTYTAAKNGIWDYIATQPNLIRKGETLIERLQNSQPKLKLTYTPTQSTDDAISKVANREAAFTVVPLIKPLPNSLTSEIIAYDGLAVFVSFSYARRNNALPQKLNGKITLEQLRQIYTSKIRNWQEISSAQLPVKLYAPIDEETNQVMVDRILPDTDKPALQQPLTPYPAFPFQSINNPISNILSEDIKPLPDIPMMRAVIQDFESRQIGGIGFNSISKIKGQCSIYPLALQPEGKPAIQPLTINKEQKINPQTDLCDRKGSIHINTEVFKNGSYPLAYPIAVVYPRDNDRSPIGEKFSQILKTQEAQRLLEKTGLVPLN